MNIWVYIVTSGGLVLSIFNEEMARQIAETYPEAYIYFFSEEAAV